MSKVEKFVQKQLTGMGLFVEKIQESCKGKTPDFLVKTDDENYLIEVKSKFDSEEEVIRQKESYERNDSHHINTKLKRNNRISKIIITACQQLQAYPDSNEYIRLVWLQTLGLSEEIQSDQILYSIYGIAYLVNNFGWKSKKSPEFKECYFFTHSDFYNHREYLDGVIIGKSNNGLLCLNPYSPKYNKLKNGVISKTMGAGVIDPCKLEKEGEAYMLTSQVNRNNESLVLKEIQKKYSNKYISIAISYAFNGSFCLKSLPNK
jgi:hypothetical protein